MEKPEVVGFDVSLEELRLHKSSDNKDNSLRKWLLEFEDNERAEERDSLILIYGAVLEADRK
jgi:hypothetical protein